MVLIISILALIGAALFRKRASAAETGQDGEHGDAP
jgi:hypothetical protein